MIKRVAGDPGHGGAFPGAKGKSLGLLEKDVNLAVALEWQRIAKANGFDAWLTRSTDMNFLPNPLKDIYHRAALINAQGADLLISFHVNATDNPGPNYMSTWVHPNASQASKDFAKVIQEELVKATKWEDGGVRVAKYAILGETRMPAVLVELGFISNPQQENLLSKLEFRYLLAEAGVRAICRVNGQVYIGPRGNTQPTKQSGYRAARAADSTIHILEVNPAEYDSRIDLGIPGKLEPLSAIVAARKAYAGINLGFFDPGGKAEHYGLLAQDGSIKNPPGKPAECYLTNDNRLVVRDLSTNTEVPQGIKWGAGGAFGLVVDGKKDLLKAEIFDHARLKEPRTAIGQKADGTLLFVVVDGRTPGNAGMTGDELATFLLQMDATNAISFDGGGSSEMIVEGAIKNKPSDGGERKIGSAMLLFKKAPAVPPAAKPASSADAVTVVAGGKEIPGRMIEDHTWAPVRPVAEALGKTVKWDGPAKRVTIE